MGLGDPRWADAVGRGERGIRGGGDSVGGKTTGPGKGEEGWSATETESGLLSPSTCLIMRVTRERESHTAAKVLLPLSEGRSLEPVGARGTGGSVGMDVPSAPGGTGQPFLALPRNLQRGDL